MPKAICAILSVCEYFVGTSQKCQFQIFNGIFEEQKLIRSSKGPLRALRLWEHLFIFWVSLKKKIVLCIDVTWQSRNIRKEMKKFRECIFLSLSPLSPLSHEASVRRYGGGLGICYEVLYVSKYVYIKYDFMTSSMFTCKYDFMYPGMFTCKYDFMYPRMFTYKLFYVSKYVHIQVSMILCLLCLHTSDFMSPSMLTY